MYEFTDGWFFAEDLSKMTEKGWEIVSASALPDDRVCAEDVAYELDPEYTRLSQGIHIVWICLLRRKRPQTKNISLDGDKS